MPETIDLRSDTVTLPPPGMRKAMHDAELGDDVYREDPTVRRLEERAADLLGKQAGLFVTSGTQGNLLAVMSSCSRGDEVVLGDQAHMFLYEVGGASALGGVLVRTVPNRMDGTLDLEAVGAAIRDGRDVHIPRTTLIGLENSHNRCGGAVLDGAYLRAAAAVAHARGVVLHLDGARLFNAAAALGVPASDLAGPVDSVSVCCSKGLAAPVGSVLCGSQDFIDQARRWRKMVGGGMRQAGVIAAGALYALDYMVDRLPDDHDHAQRLARGLASIPGIAIELERVRTNIVIFSVAPSGRSGDEIVAVLAERGLLCASFGGPLIRMVTHYGIDAAHIERALSITREAFRR